MKDVEPNQVFLDGKDRYEPDKTYTVSDGKAEYFRMNGWLKDEVEPTDETVDLDVHSVKSDNG